MAQITLDTARKLKILLGVHQFFPCPPGGTEVLTLELARGLRACGHAVHILSTIIEPTVLDKKSPWLTRDDYDDFTVYRLHYGIRQRRDPIMLHMFAPDRIRIVRELVSELKPDIVHFHHIVGFSGHVIPAIRSMSVPVIFTPTDFWTVCPSVNLFRTIDKMVCDGPADSVSCVQCIKAMPRWAARILLAIGKTSMRRLSGKINSLYMLPRRLNVLVDCVNAANRILPGTNFMANVLTRHGVDQSLINVIRYGVNIGSLPERISVPHTFNKCNPLKLGFIGKLLEFKGPHILLDALHSLQSNSSRISLDIYANLTSDTYCQTLLGKVRRLRCSAQFKGIFSHEKIGDVLRSLHLLVVPSLWYESTPLVLCCALWAGTPVAVSRLGGMTEIIQEGINGFSFPPGDAGSLAQIISSILDNPQILQRMLQDMNVQKRSRADYARDIENVYLMVLSLRN